MGTRSLTFIKDEKSTLCCIYRQFDGYPSGIGQDIFDFLKDLRLTNGMGMDTKNTANGMGCLAAQLICKLKGDTVGNVYIYPITANDVGEAYKYEITGSVNNGINVTVYDCYQKTEIFNGSVPEFGEWLSKQE